MVDELGRRLGAALHLNSALTGLTLSNCRFGPEGLAALSEGVRCTSSLRALTLHNCFGDYSEVAIFLQNWRSCSVSRLSLCGCLIGDLGLGAVARAVSGNTRVLRTLDLSDTNLTDPSELCRVLTQKGGAPSRLRALHLARNRFDQTACRELGAFLVISRLRCLDLSDCSIDAFGASTPHTSHKQCS